MDKRNVLAGGEFILAISICAFAIRQIPWTREQTHYLYTFLNVFFKGGLAIIVIICAAWFKPMKKIVLWIGSISYSLYLVHGYFLTVISQKLTNIYLLNCLIVLIISFIVAAALNGIVKRLSKMKTH